MRTSLLFSLCTMLLLSGCSGSFSGEKRGYVYRTVGGEFVCSHEPTKTEFTIDKAVLETIKSAAKNALGEGLKADELVIKLEGPSFPEPKDLVNFCRKLLNNDPIE